MEGGIRGVKIKSCPYLSLLDELQAVVVPDVVGETLELVLKQKDEMNKYDYILEWKTMYIFGGSIKPCCSDFGGLDSA